MNKALCIVMFAAGATIGSVATWQILKKKYEKIIQDEVESVKIAYKNKLQEKIDVMESSVQETSSIEDYGAANKVLKEQKGNYNNIVAKHYLSDDEISETYKHNTSVISPQEFGYDEEYNIVSLSYFPDESILVDEQGEIISIDIIGGEETLECIGDYEDYAVHVKNDHLKSYYEILVEERSYSEVFKKDE